MNRFSFFSITIAHVLLTALYAEPMESVVFSVMADKSQGTISKYLLGAHFVYCKEADAIYADGRVADWMKKTKVGVARWPGGTAVKFMHWEEPSGVLTGDPWDPKYDPAENADPSEYMGLDEYLAFCARSGVEPMVGVNLQSPWELGRVEDGIAEAVRCVEYCKQQGAKVRWWYLGNEEAMKYPDLAALVNRYADAMREVDPSIRVIINNNSGNPAKALEKILPIAGHNIDMYEIHWKWPGWQQTGTPEKWMDDSPIFGGATSTKIAGIRAKATELGYPDLLVANNEWGLSIKMKGFDKYTTSLVAVEYLLDLFQNGFDMACFWNTQWPGKAHAHLLDFRDDYAFNPIAKGFELLSPALEQEMLASRSSEDTVVGFACQDKASETYQVFLLNKNTTAISVAIEGLPQEARFDAAGRFMRAPGKELKTLRVKMSGSSPQVSLPPRSFCRIRFQRGG